MKNRPTHLLFILLLAAGQSLTAQPLLPHRYGGIGSDYAYDIARAADSSMYIGGFSCSQISGDKTENPRGNYDYWLVKTDAAGKTLWEKTIGGEESDLLRRVKIGTNGTVIMAGSSLSAGGFGEKISAGKGSWDFWIVEVSPDKQILTEYGIGGPGTDLLGDFVILGDNCRLHGGSSMSGTGGDKSAASRGGYDYWLVKTDSTGKVLWDKTYGGSGDDFLAAILPAADGGFLLIGFSGSGAGYEKTEPSFGETDFWVVKVDAQGNVLWNTTIGSDKKEWATGAAQLEDGGYLVAGYFESGASGRDFRVVKLNPNGIKIWEKTYLAPGDQELNALALTCGGFLLVGATHAGAGNGDFIAMKVNETGDSLWTLTAGGGRQDIGTALLPYYDAVDVVGYIHSNDGAFPNSRGSTDYGLIKMPFPPGQECIAVQEIPLQKGWNMISSYVRAGNPDMLAIVAPIAGSVDLVKNDSALVAYPDSNINLIDKWVNTKGYQVLANQDTVLTISGSRVPPDTPIPLHPGWQMIAYLRDSPLAADVALAGVKGSAILAKNNAGNVYAPAYNINTIGSMVSGQGYWLKMSAADTLRYPAALTGPGDSEFAFLSANPQHFIFNPVNTGNNATLIVPALAAENSLKSGDEIGVFSPGGVLCGAAVYEGQNLAVTIWGDDAATPQVVEYLAAGQAFQLRIWNAVLDEEYPVDFGLESGSAVYQTNGLYVLSIVTSVPKLEEITEFHYFPNPTTGRLQLDFHLKSPARLRFELLSADGKYLTAILEQAFSTGPHSYSLDMAKYADGLYYLRAITDTGSQVYPLVLEKK